MLMCRLQSTIPVERNRAHAQIGLQAAMPTGPSLTRSRRPPRCSNMNAAMMTMATNCNPTRQRISFCDKVRAGPPRHRPQTKQEHDEDGQDRECGQMKQRGFHGTFASSFSGVDGVRQTDMPLSTLGLNSDNGKRVAPQRVWPARRASHRQRSETSKRTGTQQTQTKRPWPIQFGVLCIGRSVRRSVPTAISIVTCASGAGTRRGFVPPICAS